MKYYQRNNEFMKVTNQSPRGFKNVLFVCQQGTDPNALRESCIDHNTINKQGWTEVQSEDLPSEWKQVFKIKEPETKPETKPHIERRKLPRNITRRQADSITDLFCNNDEEAEVFRLGCAIIIVLVTLIPCAQLFFEILFKTQ